MVKKSKEADCDKQFPRHKVSGCRPFVQILSLIYLKNFTQFPCKCVIFQQSNSFASFLGPKHGASLNDVLSNDIVKSNLGN